jgi:hypothetical protein
VSINDFSCMPAMDPNLCSVSKCSSPDIAVSGLLVRHAKRSGQGSFRFSAGFTDAQGNIFLRESVHLQKTAQ